MAVTSLFAAHLAELLGVLREVVAETFGEIVEDAGVLLFHGNGEGKDFALVEALKGAHGDQCIAPRRSLGWNICTGARSKSLNVFVRADLLIRRRCLSEVTKFGISANAVSIKISPS